MAKALPDSFFLKKMPKIWDLTAQLHFRNIALPKSWHWLP